MSANPTVEDSTVEGLSSMAQQGSRQLGGALSILAKQKYDHMVMGGLLRQLGTVAAEYQDDVLRRLYRLVFCHAFAEEAVVWPLIRRVLPDGEQLTLHAEREHQEVNELVTLIESTTAGSVTRQPLLDRLVDALREDVRHEEDELLPRLQARLDARQLRALGFAWATVRRVAPTRAHPVVSRRPPGNALAALPLTVVDRLRDRIDRRIRRSTAERHWLHNSSRLLTTAAHTIEHAPMLRRDHPDPAAIAPAASRPSRT